MQVLMCEWLCLLLSMDRVQNRALQLSVLELTVLYGVSGFLHRQGDPSSSFHDKQQVPLTCELPLTAPVSFLNCNFSKTFVSIQFHNLPFMPLQQYLSVL